MHFPPGTNGTIVFLNADFFKQEKDSLGHFILCFIFSFFSVSPHDSTKRRGKINLIKVLNVVVTLRFNAKMVLANFECNLND